MNPAREMCDLEGLLDWKRRRRSDDADEAIASGQEVLVQHRMFRSHTTGDVIDKRWTRFSFPPRWHYDILRGLDHLRDAGAGRDPRASEAIELVGSQQHERRWPVGPIWPGKIFFTMEEPGGPGRWNTLRAWRVLNWWGSTT
jgi:hypothetical protein